MGWDGMVLMDKSSSDQLHFLLSTNICCCIRLTTYYERTDGFSFLCIQSKYSQWSIVSVCSAEEVEEETESYLIKDAHAVNRGEEETRVWR